LDVLGVTGEGARDLVSYCLEEILRNVDEHADSPVNALLQAQFYSATGEAVFAIGDTGRGILHSLRQWHQNLEDDEEALRYALRPRPLREGTGWPGVLVAMVMPREDGRDWGKVLAQVLEEI